MALSIQQHKVLNAKHAHETTETALVQIKSVDGRWRDYARSTIEAAITFVQNSPVSREVRIVDWITGEEINWKAGAQELPEFYWYVRKLVVARSAVSVSREALRNGNKEELKENIEVLLRVAGELKAKLDGS